MRIANATNGLMFPPYDAVSMFLSTHGHNCKFGYFADYAMPWGAVVELLSGRPITFVDATKRKQMPDSIKFGLTTWAMVFNRAVGHSGAKVAPWETKEMRRVAGNMHDSLVGRIRRLAAIYGSAGPAIIGENIKTEIHRNFQLDDKPQEIGAIIKAGSSPAAAK